MSAKDTRAVRGGHFLEVAAWSRRRSRGMRLLVLGILFSVAGAAADPVHVLLPLEPRSHAIPKTPAPQPAPALCPAVRQAVPWIVAVGALMATAHAISPDEG